MRIRLSLICALFLYSMTYFYGQIVSISPAFPSRTEEITITYDATQGSRGLLDVNQVYMHTGLVTSTSVGNEWRYVQGNWGTDDPRVKMTNIGNNRHQIKVSINSFYGIPASEQILRLAFVFRNVNGTREGKTADFQDIFLDFNDGQGFTAFVQSPVEKNFLLPQNTGFNFQAVSSVPAILRLIDNGVEISRMEGVTQLSYPFTASTVKDHLMEFQAILGQDTLRDTIRFAVIPDRRIMNPPVLLSPGIQVLDGNRVALVLEAPRKSHVYVVGDFSDWAFSNQYFMNVSPDGELWWLILEDLDATKPHAFQYVVDGSIRVADPYSTVVLDGFHDQFVRQTHLDGLPPYPAGKTNGYVSVIEWSQPEFTWQNDDYARPEKADLIIYEMLLRDFTESHDYQSLIDSLPYLKKLGINAIELMPVQEFEGNQSWGYNPSYHNALDKYYGTRTDFKRFVDAAHGMGIAVIVDVVFNHAFGQNPLVRLYWDSQNNRPAADNPWLNPVERHPFNVGFDFNHESLYTQRYMDRILRYWIEEYHVDGYRFDLSKGFTQRQSNNNDQFSAYDDSRVRLLKRVADQIWSVDPEFHVILEHFAANSEEKELAEYGMMFWGNHNFNFSEAAMGYHDGGKSNFSGISYQNRGWNVPHLIGYAESHDEERMMYRNIQFGGVGPNHNTKEISTALKRMELAAHFLYMVPGPKMIWQFGELGYDYSINTCINGTVNNNCRLDPKPVRWDYLDEAPRKRLYDIYTTLGQLRATYDVFRSTNFQMNVSGPQKSITLRTDTLNLLLIGNFDLRAGNISVTFPSVGTWFDFYSGTSIEVTTLTQILPMEAGSYRLFSDRKLFEPEVISSIGEVAIPKKVFIYPNPIQDRVWISWDDDAAEAYTWELYDMMGRCLDSRKDSDFMNGESFSTAHLPNGMYLLKINTKSAQFIEKLMIQK